MPSVKISSLPIDRNTVEEIKEKLLGLPVENENANENEYGNDNDIGNEDENGEFSENEYTYNDERTDDINEVNKGGSTFSEVALLLDGMGMKKYIQLFRKENIDLNVFLNLTEKDLEEIGIQNKRDRKVIVSNLGDHKEPSHEYFVEENHTHDYQIIKNVQNQLTLLQNYCAYIECEMKRKRLTDYSITSKETAMTYFIEFANAALQQSDIISDLIYQEDSSNHLLAQLLKPNDLVLPQELQEKLITKKNKKKRYSTCVIGVIGLSLVLIFAAKKLLKTIIH